MSSIWFICWHQTIHSCGALAKPGWKSLSAWPIIPRSACNAFVEIILLLDKGVQRSLAVDIPLCNSQQLQGGLHLHPGPAIDEADSWRVGLQH